MTKREHITSLRNEGRTYDDIMALTGYPKSTVSYYCSLSTKSKALDYQRLHRDKVKDFMDEYKASRGCSKCPENDPIALDFHHVSGKEFGIGSIARANKYSIARVSLEIAKCVVLCSNCHRKEHRDRLCA